MPRLTTVQTNFASGEIDPTLRGQHDIKAYKNGVRRLRNMQRRATGGAERRFGTYDLGPMLDARLAEFEFSDTQRYVLAFSAGTLDVFDLNGVLLQSLAGQPWTTAQADELSYTQLGDVMVITHQAWATRLLRRTSGVTFSLGLFAFEVSIDGNRVWQPYFKFAGAAASLTPSAGTGSVSLLASVPVFDALHIGTRFRIYDTEVLITAVADSTHATATVQGTLKGKLDLDPYKTMGGSAVVEVLHLFHGLTTGTSITLSGSNSVGGIAGSALDGVFTVTVIDDIRYSIVAGAAATSSVDGGGTNVGFIVAGTATRSWAEPAISALRGYPGTCSFHEGRLWLVGTTSQPDAEFGSKALQPFNFDVDKGYDADSVQVASGSEDVSRVRHIVSNGDLQLFTATRESVFITRDGEAITPNNARVKGQTANGSGGVMPVVFDSATLFVQENGLSVSEFAYSASQGGYTATVVSTLASHLIRNPTSIAASAGLTSRSEQFAFFNNGDGSMAVFHSLRAENIAGFGLWELGAGGFRSVCCIGPYVFFCVAVRGGFRLYRLAEDNIGCLDGQVVHVAPAATVTWTLDARVRGRQCAAVSELGYHGLIDVPADGVVQLLVPVTRLTVGDPFYFILETLPPDVTVPTGERTGLKKRIVRSVIDFEDAYAVTIDGVRIETRQAGDDFAGAVRPVTGSYEVRHLGFDRDPTTVISQTEPLPGAILSINQEVKV